MTGSLVGCVSPGGSLASTTGPSAGVWSTADPQIVHVGERVRFSFVLTASLNAEQGIEPSGIVDYCFVRIGQDLLETGIGEFGHFEVEHVFDALPPGQEVTVTATGYRMLGSRDRRLIAGEWITRTDFDQTDRVICQDDLTLTAYKSRIELPVQPDSDDWDIAGGGLALIRRDGRTTVVRASQNGEDGFEVRGPFDDGKYMVTYEPSAEMLNSSGTTQVRFTVMDDRGRQHVIERLLSTP